MTSACRLLNLPTELLLTIISHIDIPDVLALSRVLPMPHFPNRHPFLTPPRPADNPLSPPPRPRPSHPPHTPARHNQHAHPLPPAPPSPLLTRPTPPHNLCSPDPPPRAPPLPPARAHQAVAPPLAPRRGRHAARHAEHPAQRVLHARRADRAPVLRRRCGRACAGRREAQGRDGEDQGLAEALAGGQEGGARAGEGAE